MKKLILAALTASVAFSPLVASAADAQGHREARQTTIVKRNGNVVHKTVVRQTARQYRSDWRKGQRFDQRQARNYRQIDYRNYRGLRAPPRGYHYVQSGNDAVLVGITSGIIAAVVTNAIR
ncbi:RcnB family protein [Sphingomonas crusticola]|uniref:RcnB family protein n=1 Tax=Sphingomonas crusticola TaxID=1697973 RepID=UPI003B832465